MSKGTTGTRSIRRSGWVALALVMLALAACTGGPVKRVSEPSARIQQLTVGTDGRWTAQLRIENFSSIPMRFDSVNLIMSIEGAEAGRVQTEPNVSIAGESADVVDVQILANAGAKLAVADALGAGRTLNYTLDGTIVATPEDKKQKSFNVERSSALSPAPGLPGVLR